MYFPTLSNVEVNVKISFDKHINNVFEDYYYYYYFQDS